MRLLAGASDEPEERYLLNLIRRGSQKLGRPVETAEAIAGDGDAVKILNHVYAEVVMDGVDEGRFAHRPPRFSFTHDPNGVWTGADLNLFLAMLLVNRTGLVRLFFLREGRQNAASVLPNALWACLLCRRLSTFDGVGTDSYYLKNGFQARAPRRPPGPVVGMPHNWKFADWRHAHRSSQSARDSARKWSAARFGK